MYYFIVTRQYLVGNHLENVIHDAMTKCLATMAKETGPFDPEPCVDLIVFYILKSLCFGER